MLTSPEQDAQARARIKEEISRNFFVEAAAGSGKTTSLVDRMIAMVGAGIDVGKICAITFTKAAAKEFYRRFQDRLAAESRSEPDAERRQRYADALRNIDLCFMGTIDAFSNMLLHEHPLEAGIPSETVICDYKEAIPAYLAEYARIKRGEYGEALRTKYERFRTVQKNPDQTFASCIGIFTERSEADFVYEPPTDMDVNTSHATWKNKLVQLLNQLVDHPELAGSGKGIQTELQKYPALISVMREDWNPRIGDVLAAMDATDRGKSREADNLRLNHDKQIIAPDDLVSGVNDAFDTKVDKKGNIKYYYLNLKETDAYRTMRRVQYAATMDFLVSAAKAIAAELRGKGSMTFHDALLTLRNMLRRDAEQGGRLIRHIANRHSFYLVDEFQDTDPLQAEVVFYLAAQEPHPDWTACAPRPGALFIVGDPKQSIYRFRGADVSSYLRVQSLFEENGDTVLMLSRNFRSTAKIRGWFNDVFPGILRERTDVQSAFHPIPITETDDDTALSGIYTYTCTANRNISALQDDAEQITAVIRRLIGNPAVRLKNGKPPAFRDFMVIVNRKKETAAVAGALLSAGIPVRVEGKIDFTECPALAAAVSVFTAAAKPFDTMALFLALRSDVYGFPESEIRRFCGCGGRLNIFTEQEKMPAGFTALKQAFAEIREFAAAGYSTDSAALFAKIADSTHLLAKTGSRFLEYFAFAAELLRHAEAEGRVQSHADAAAFLQSLLTESGEERCVSLSPDDNRVHVANLHKVKGLQAPVVILADPLISEHAPRMRVIHHPDRTECRIFSMKCDKVTVAETERFAADFDDECECDFAERQRLLYVAATRAEQVLIIGDSVKESGGPTGKNPWEVFLPHAEGRLADCVPENPEVISAPDVRTDAEALYTKAEAESVFANTDVLSATYQLVRPSRIRLKPVISEEPEDQAAREPFDRNAALTGTLVHRLMEYVVSGGIPADGDALISAILREFGAEDAVYRPLLGKVLDRMRNGGYPENGDLADLLRVLRKADAVYCEVPFCQQQGSEIVNGVIDLLYRTGDVWHIIDYKTNAEQKQLAEKYAAQLSAYKDAVRAIVGAEADTGIYHIDV